MSPSISLQHHIITHMGSQVRVWFQSVINYNTTNERYWLLLLRNVFINTASCNQGKSWLNNRNLILYCRLRETENIPGSAWKNMSKCLSHHAFIIVNNVHYVVNGIIWTWPPVVVMFTCCFILYRWGCNVWWCVTHRHPSKQCPACLSTNIVLPAGYATHVWNYIMSKL